MFEQRWSDDLIQLTRAAAGNGGQAIWNVKHTSGDFGLASSGANGKGFFVAQHATGAVLTFDSLEGLIDGGWAID